MSIPNDPIILLSYVNTQLRDFYPNLEEMCKSLNISKENLIHKLKSIDYHYSIERNQFI